MNRYLIFSILFIGSIFQLSAQVKYVGLSRVELKALSSVAATLNDKQELEKLDSYLVFLNDLDTLNQVFSKKLAEPSTSEKLKVELKTRLQALEELKYHGKKYREFRSLGNEVDAGLSLAEYYRSLEKLGLKEYFLNLNESPDLEPEAESQDRANISYQSTSKLSYYLGMGLNYSLVSYSLIEADPASLGPGISFKDEPIGGVSRDFHLGASYKINQDFSAYLELGWSGHNLTNESRVSIVDPTIPGGQTSILTRRNIQHRYTNLQFGAAYAIEKGHIKLGLQFSFLNSFDLNIEQNDPFSGEINSQEYNPEAEYGFTKTRGFLILGADYPVYNFNFGDQRFFVDAYFQASVGLSSVLDDEAEPQIVLFNNTETFNNSLLHLGLRLRL